MYWDDHPPPHFHAIYAGLRMSVEIETLQVTAGDLPPHIRRKVLEWAAGHLAELLENWERREAGLPTYRIQP